MIWMVFKWVAEVMVVTFIVTLVAVLGASILDQVSDDE